NPAVPVETHARTTGVPRRTVPDTCVPRPRNRDFALWPARLPVKLCEGRLLRWSVLAGHKAQHVGGGLWRTVAPSRKPRRARYSEASRRALFRCEPLRLPREAAALPAPETARLVAPALIGRFPGRAARRDHRARDNGPRSCGKNWKSRHTARGRQL